MRLALLAALLPLAGSAAPFEGVLEGKMEGPHASGNTRAYVSPAGLRAEVGMVSPAARKSGLGTVRVVTIYRSDEPGRMLVLDAERKTYRVQEVVTEGQAAQGWTVKRGGTAEVAGLACEKAELTSARGDKAEVCLSAEVGGDAPWVKHIQQGGAGIGGGLVRALGDAGLRGYPLRWVHKATGAASAVSMEVTRVRREKVPEAAFRVPRGYKQAAPPAGKGLPVEAYDHMRQQEQKLTPEQKLELQQAMEKARAEKAGGKQ
ncbi:MAG: DUF4412 domain-containing protein [Deltaproteobacteria bacterium]|nr:DUF4412 domain-containing protein [Deltaproteobacteria bacterium]